MRAKDPYEVVILDLDMPIMNGFDTCARIRKKDNRESLKQLLDLAGVMGKRPTLGQQLMQDYEDEE